MTVMEEVDYAFDESVDGDYGSFAMRRTDRRYWNCYESSDYHFVGIVDDYGVIVILPGTTMTNLRGY